jgi:hypothetical protein
MWLSSVPKHTIYAFCCLEIYLYLYLITKGVMIVAKYIDALVENLKIPKDKTHIDLVLDGGAFKGSYTIGVLHFIHKLESIHWFKIHRISGCSIGSIAALLYLTNKLHLSDDFYKVTRVHFAQHYNLECGKDWLNTFRKKHMHKQTYLCLNNRLFITYWDIKERKQIIRSTYKNNKDVIETIIRSCFVPFLFNGDSCWKGRYVDGFYPFMFKKRDDRKIIVLNLLRAGDVFEMLCIKNEVNNYGRIFEGILDFYVFMKKKPCKFCSYLDKWSMMDYIYLNLRIFLVYYFINICAFYKKIYKFIPNEIGYLITQCELQLLEVYKINVIHYCI